MYGSATNTSTSADSGEQAAAYILLYICWWVAVYPRHTERFNNMFVAVAKLRKFCETAKYLEGKFVN